MVDLTRDAKGRLGLGCWTWSRAVPVRCTRAGCVSGVRRSGPGSRSPPWTRSTGTRTPSMTSCRTPVSVLDAFHVVKLATSVVDEVRRRVQQETNGHRGRKDDPLYRIRNILRAGQENLTDRQRARLAAAFAADERHLEVEVAYRCAQQVRSAYHQDSHAAGRGIAEKIVATFAACPIPEVARLGRTLKQWRTRVPRLLRHRRRVQRRHRSRQRPHRTPPPHRPRLHATATTTGSGCSSSAAASDCDPTLWYEEIP